MDKRLATKVLRLRPEFAVNDSHFYYLPAERILCGFVYERVRDYAYIWRFARPLYEKLESLNLNFGDRLPESVGSMRRFRLKIGPGAAEEFVRQIEPYEEETRSWQNPQTFLHHFESPRTIGNPWVRRTIAFTHILLGNPTEARTHLNILIRDATTQIYTQIVDDASLILRELNSGLDRAQETLVAWEMETKRKFQLKLRA